MQVAVETVSGLERRMTVELPEDQLTTEIDERLRSLATSARIPGFRPGKVPRKVLVNRFGKQLRQEVVGELIRSSFVEAVENENLRPAGGPAIDPVEADDGAGLRYTATFEVYPEIQLADLSNVSITRPSAEVTDDDLKAMIANLREQRKTWHEVERGAAEGDRVTVDFTGSIDGEEFEGGKAENTPLELGSGRMIPGFEEALQGLSAGMEKTAPVTFPEDYHATELAGKEAQFTFVVHKVEESRLPEVDAEFMKAFGVESGELDAFHADIRANMERELDNAIKNKTKEQVMNALLEHNPVEVPNALVQEQSQQLVAQRNQELANMGIDPVQLGLTPEQLEPDARKRVQLGLLFGELIRTAELKADPLVVREEVEKIASTYEDSAQVINWFYGESGRLGEIESQVLEAAAVEWFLGEVKVEEESTTFDALLNPNRTQP